MPGTMLCSAFLEEIIHTATGIKLCLLCYITIITAKFIHFYHLNGSICARCEESHIEKYAVLLKYR